MGAVERKPRSSLASFSSNGDGRRYSPNCFWYSLTVVATDRAGQPAGEHEPRTARKAVAPCKEVLGIGKPGPRRIDLAGMMSEVRESLRRAAPESSQQIRRLMLQMIEIRPDEPRERMPGVRQIGRRRFVANLPHSGVSGGLGPLRGLEASCTLEPIGLLTPRFPFGPAPASRRRGVLAGAGASPRAPSLP